MLYKTNNNRIVGVVDEKQVMQITMHHFVMIKYNIIIIIMLIFDFKTPH